MYLIYKTAEDSWRFAKYLYCDLRIPESRELFLGLLWAIPQSVVLGFSERARQIEL